MTNDIIFRATVTDLEAAWGNDRDMDWDAAYLNDDDIVTAYREDSGRIAVRATRPGELNEWDFDWMAESGAWDGDVAAILNHLATA